MLHEVQQLVYAIGPLRAARELGVHRTTVLRWITGKVTPPASAVALLRSLVHGNAPSAGKEWEGWRFAGEYLLSPANEKFEPGDLLAMRYLRALAEHQRKQIRELERKLVAATRAAEAVDPAANDTAVWPTDVRTIERG